MNISTYEARIKALEAQLGPGPGPKTGLLSVAFNPDITLDDESSLNEMLADLMPIESGDSKTVSVRGFINTDVDYKVTSTPGSEWQILAPGATPGNPQTGNLNVEFDGSTAKATLTVVAADAVPPTNTARLNLQINVG